MARQQLLNSPEKGKKNWSISCEIRGLVPVRPSGNGDDFVTVYCYLESKTVLFYRTWGDFDVVSESMF